MRAESIPGRKIRIVGYTIERPAGAWRTTIPGGVIRTVGHSTQTMIGDRYWPRMPRPLLDKCVRIEAKVLEVLDRSINEHCNICFHPGLSDGSHTRRLPDEHIAWIDIDKLTKNLEGFDLSREVIAAMTPPPSNVTPRLSTNREAVAAVIRATMLNLTNYLIKMIDEAYPNARRYVILAQE